MDYRSCASQIYEQIGGKDNLISAAHCATRLRLVIADNSKVNVPALEEIDGVKGVFDASGQLQLIIGTGTVNKVYDEFIDIAGIEASTKEELKQVAASKAPWWKRAIKTLGDIFIPIIPAIVATGLLNGLLGGLVQVWPSMADSYFYNLVNMFSNTALTFLPILIAISAAKIFGGNIYLGAVIGMIMIHPSLVNAWTVASGAETSTLWSWFGAWNIDNVGYQGHVIPIVLSVWLMCAIEKKLHKIVPEMFDLFVTPLCSVLAAGFIAMTVIGPIFAQIETWVLSGAKALIAIPFGIGAFLMGGFYAPTVLAGAHHMYNAIEMMMLSDNGMNIWMPIATAANVAQGAAALAVSLKTKNKKTKSMALPASLSAFMGITEPAIFGVNIRYGKPFIAGMIGGAVGACIASIAGVYATANGITGLFGLLIVTDCLPGYLLSFAVASVVAFAASWLLYKDEEKAASAPADSKPAMNLEPNTVYAPLKGEIIPLTESTDPVFASEALGKGIAINPSEGKVVAPFNGTVAMLYDTKHAIGLVSDDGIEVLIHIGLDTVKLNGEHFTAHVAQGDKVSCGQTLVTFDMNAITKAGYPLVTPVIVSNTPNYSEVNSIKMGETDLSEKILAVAK
ncbi:PTS beta-glucoside transporter subunit IIBCA [Pseudobutyrivibrio sp. MD2005]|uniref:PTS beta-glucoside transporter subunit IIBCA n=1 Tax=Pseudobutyrivibrio sp. MD2005 TaxID=1410616 RepID=UPI0004868A88|nr:PTS transporter subunit IIBCA [Pseudobutyrivibrio sp. MD2005]